MRMSLRENQKVDMSLYENWMAAVSNMKALSSQRAERAPLPSAPLPKNVVRPLAWPEPVRAVPNSFLRTALFSVLAEDDPRRLDDELVPSPAGVEIRYTGQRLDQGDLDVWGNVLHAVRLQPLGSQCRLKAYGLLKLLDKTDTGKNRADLHKRIERLYNGKVEITQDQYVYKGALLKYAAKDEITKEWIIEVDEKLEPLFKGDQFTYIEWAVRRELGKKYLAKWLHGFYASHSQPFPLKINTLHQLCGSQAGEMWTFAQTLRKALAAVAEASAAHGAGFSYEIRGDLVHIEKKAQGAQRRHLNKKVVHLPCQRIGNNVPANRR